MKKSCQIALIGMLALVFLAGSAQAASKGKMRCFTIDVGTGLALYVELPSDQDGGRPYRIVYDTGKGASKGLDNDLVSFLVSEKVGLRPASADFEGDIIDFFVLSHPHEDHFNGALPLFDLFDVRNIIESKQIPAMKYMSRFKGPAINEIMAAKAAGKDAHYYVVGLPYPNGFDQPRDGQPYDEYEICNNNMPEFMQGVVDARAYKGAVTFPFGPDQVAQPVNWPVRKLMADVEKTLKHVKPEYLDEDLEVDVIPVGTRFDLGRYGGFTVVHGDTIAAFDPHKEDSSDYKPAFPYYSDSDLNDGSVSIQVTYKKASVFVPGDTEGRLAKPTTMMSLKEVFSTGAEGKEYTEDDVMDYLRWNNDSEEQLPILDSAYRYVVGSETLRQLAYYAYVTYDFLSIENLEIKTPDGERTIVAKQYQSPDDLDPTMIHWEKRNDLLKATIHPNWKHRVYTLFRDLYFNKQKKNGLKTRFKGWARGKKPRITFNDQEGKFWLDWKNPRWNLINLIQIAERIYYVDPGLANIMAGFIIRSKDFLDYMAPPDEAKQALRGEKHMIHVADEILRESGVDVLKSDVLLFGHHGSYTSSSFGFVQRVRPNVGIISADDKSYSGSTLPDFSSLFWNMNTKHPKSRAILHSIFFHADMLARMRGEPRDAYAEKNRFSPSAVRVFRARKRFPIPIWRTDINDDLVDKNTLVDNILIETDGTDSIWRWAADKEQDEMDQSVRQGMAKNPENYPYWSLELISAHPGGSNAIRPIDPSGIMSTFTVGNRLDASGGQALDDEFGADSYEQEDEEDWTRRAAGHDF